MNNRRRFRFVQAVLGTQKAPLQANNEYRVQKGSRFISLPHSEVEQLVSDGILRIDEGGCFASPLAPQWVKRGLLEEGAFADQHRTIISQANGTRLNALEGPVAQLGTSKKGADAFLQKHHVLAANKIHALVQRAQMLQRTTMSYDPTRTGSSSAKHGPGPELGDSALDARQKLNACLQDMPEDCGFVVLDVCGFQKGLQLIETERKWPRRSAKLILRVGLEQAAKHFGLSACASGAPPNRPQFWMQKGARAGFLQKS